MAQPYTIRLETAVGVPQFSYTRKFLSEQHACDYVTTMLPQFAGANWIRSVTLFKGDDFVASFSLSTLVNIQRA